MLVAHRGASAYAPENTIAAFDLALRHRADAIECDTRLTADGVPVLCHDATLERIAGRPDRVADLSLADLKSIDAGAWKGPEWAGTRIPTLAEALLWSATGLPLIVEIKAGDDPGRLTAAVLAAYRDCPAARLLCFSSFSIDLLSRLQRIAPDLPRALITSTLDGAVDAARSVGASALHVQAAAITLPLPKLPIGAWTVDDPAEAARLVAMGVTTVFSNRPRDLRHTVPPLAA